MLLHTRLGHAGVATLNEPILGFVRAARDRVAFQRQLSTGRAEIHTFSGADCPGELAKAVRSISGMDRGSSPVRSIRSLLSASVHGRYCMYLATDRVGSEASDPEEAGFQTYERMDISMLIDRSPVIEGKDFVDLSIEVPPTLQARASLLSQIPAMAADLDVPVGHVHLPIVSDEGQTFRAGFGVPAGDQARELRLVGRAMEIAESAGSSMQARGPSFNTWEQLRPATPAVLDPEAGPHHRWEMTFVAEARVGRLSELLTRLADVGIAPSHCVMTVLEGCTVASLGGFSTLEHPTLQARVEAVASEEETALGAKVWTDQSATEPPSFDVEAPSDQEPLWVGWRCRNVPGELSRLLDVLGATLGEGYNITYVASRTIHGGGTNAGKLRAIPTRPDSTVGRRVALEAAMRESALTRPVVIDIAPDESTLRHTAGRIAW